MSVIEINHPLIEHKMTILRSVDTDTKSFRENLNEIAKLMTYEATKKLKLEVTEVTTPLMKTQAYTLQDKVSALEAQNQMQKDESNTLKAQLAEVLQYIKKG